MMKGNTPQRTGHQPVKLYTCLQTAQCKVTQPTVGQYHFTQLSKVNYIKHFKTYLLHTNESLRMAQVHNINKKSAYTQLPRSIAKVEA